jgi:hypothetical protein
MAKIASGKIRHINTVVWALTVLFLLRYAYLGWE